MSAAWFEHALDDLRVAEILYAASPPLLEPGVYHVQQLVEKALKAHLIWHQAPLEKIHDLVRLGKSCIAADPAFRVDLELAAELTVLAGVYRYPTPTGRIAEEQAFRLLAYGRTVLAAVLERLPPEAHP